MKHPSVALPLILAAVANGGVPEKPAENFEYPKELLELVGEVRGEVAEICDGEVEFDSGVYEQGRAKRYSVTVEMPQGGSCRAELIDLNFRVRSFVPQQCSRRKAGNEDKDSLSDGKFGGNDYFWALCPNGKEGGQSFLVRLGNDGHYRIDDAAGKGIPIRNNARRTWNEEEKEVVRERFLEKVRGIVATRKRLKRAAQKDKFQPFGGRGSREAGGRRAKR